METEKKIFNHFVEMALQMNCDPKGIFIPLSASLCLVGMKLKIFRMGEEIQQVVKFLLNKSIFDRKAFIRCWHVKSFQGEEYYSGSSLEIGGLKQTEYNLLKQEIEEMSGVYMVYGRRSDIKDFGITIDSDNEIVADKVRESLTMNISYKANFFVIDSYANE